MASLLFKLIISIRLLHRSRLIRAPSDKAAIKHYKKNKKRKKHHKHHHPHHKYMSTVKMMVAAVLKIVGWAKRATSA